ncbi:unnamed protein product [Closterium sp. Yama58-4]|nr:unnamed protein product [Closterium sp. Yama58-4]
MPPARSRGSIERRRALEQPDLQVLPPHVWATLGGLGLAATVGLFGVLGLITEWEVPGLPHLSSLLCVPSFLRESSFLPPPVIFPFPLHPTVPAARDPFRAPAPPPESWKARFKWRPRARQQQQDMDPPPWSLTAAAVCRALHVVRDVGLHKEVAQARLARHGVNEIESLPVPTFLAFLIPAVYTPTRLLLLFLLVLFTALCAWSEALVGVACVLLLLLLDTFAEWLGRRGLASACLAVPHDALVLRDGVAVTLPRRLLVPGDIVLLRPGMEVPADVRLLHCSLLEIDESAVSGEWEAAPCPKDAAAIISGRTTAVDCANIALAGTIVTCGYGSGVVFRTGKNTEIGRKIAAAAKHHRSRLLGGAGEVSPLLLVLRGAARWSTLVAVVFTLVVAGLGVYRAVDWQTILLTSLAFFFAALPENLPAIFYSTLGAGSQRLVQNEIFFKELRAVENLSYVDTILTDKSGSLTEERLDLQGLLVASTAIGVEELAVATREMPKGGPLAAEGGMEALGKLLEAWVFMSDMGDDLLAENLGGSAGGRGMGGAGAQRGAEKGEGLGGRGHASGGVGGQVGGSGGEGEGSGSEEGAKVNGKAGESGGAAEEGTDAEFLAAIAKEAKEAGAGDVSVDIRAGAEEEQSESLLESGRKAGDPTPDVAARGGHVDALDWAILGAVGGPSVLTSLPYEGLEGVEAEVAAATASAASTTTKGLRPLHDLLRRCYEAKAAARRLTDTPYESSLKCAVRTYADVRTVVGGAGGVGVTRGKSVQKKLLALGKSFNRRPCRGRGLCGGFHMTMMYPLPQCPCISPPVSALSRRPHLPDLCTHLHRSPVLATRVADASGQLGADAQVSAGTGSSGGSGSGVCELRQRVFVRGPPEVLLQQCGTILHRGEPASITSSRATIQEQINELTEQGLVLVAYASGDMLVDSPRASSRPAILACIHDCTFLGVVLAAESPRPGVNDAVRSCQQAGVRPVVVTGDHMATAAALAKTVGLCKGGQQPGAAPEVVSCVEKPAAQTPQEELSALVQASSVFARASPIDRLCILEALQANGAFVAACGTGIVDAPVVAEADVGLAVGAAPDVVRDAAAVVVLDGSFGAVRFLLEEGRALLLNLRKATALTLGTRLGLALLMLAGTLWVNYPLQPTQIIIAAVFLNAASLFSYTVELPDADTMLHPPRHRTQPFFDLPLLSLSAAATIATVTASLLALAFSLRTALQGDTQTVVFVAWLLASCLVGFHMRTFSQPLFSKGLGSNSLVLLWLLAVVVFCVLLGVFPWLQKAVHVVSLTPTDWGIVAAIAVIGTVWIDLCKLLVAKSREHGYEVPSMPVPVGGRGGGARGGVGVAPLLPSTALKSDVEMT